MVLAYDTKKLKFKLEATAFGTKMSVPLKKGMENACNYLTTGKCPIKKGDEITWKISQSAVDIPFTVNSQIKATLLDEHGKNFVCTQIKGIIHA